MNEKLVFIAIGGNSLIKSKKLRTVADQHETEQYIAGGHFAPGSMLPKIQSALRFLKNGGKEVIITSPEFIKEVVTSGRGTHIVP